MSLVVELNLVSYKTNLSCFPSEEYKSINFEFVSYMPGQKHSGPNSNIAIHKIFISYRRMKIYTLKTFTYR